MRSNNICAAICVLITLCLFPTVPYAQPKVKLGADVLLEKRLDLVKGKRVGIVTNHTGLLSSGKFLVDTLIALRVEIVALFGPEHGIRGEAAAGERVQDGIDVKTGLPVFSLFGDRQKPTPEMLNNVDVLLYDIQDVGARFYTYTSTMAFVMEAAAERNIPIIVLDRPNPLGGMQIDGPILEDSLRSFVGMFPIPVVYGLTCGELARMINGEYWLGPKTSGVAYSLRAPLIVVEMEGWRRSMRWEDTNLHWIRPSPNIPSPSAALVYPATCFIEATNLSEGRGTERPFQMFGAPFINGEVLSAALTALHLQGVRFRPVDFTPRSSKFSGRLCHGVFIEVTEVAFFQPVQTGLYILQLLQQQYRQDFKLNEASLKRLLGSTGALKMLQKGDSPEKIVLTWEAELSQFRYLAERYYLYP